MPEHHLGTCYSCIAGREASRTSVGAAQAYAHGLTARGARKPRETGVPRTHGRSGSPRRLPTAAELRERGLDVVERGERRTRGEEVIRAVMLS
jgi:hypothetical protein